MNEKPKTTRKRGKHLVRKLVTLLVVLLVLGGAGWYVYSSMHQETVVTYDSYTASIGSISNSLSFSGSLQLVNDQTCTAGSATTVRNVYVAEGDKVKKGDKLMRLASGETFEADFDGTVNQVYYEKDDSVAAGASLLEVADFEHLKVSVRVTEYNIAQVKVGAECTVTATATNKTFPSVISSINYISVAPGNVAYYTTVCYIDVEDGSGVYPGMQVTITIPQDSATDVVVLKEDALTFDRANNAFVYKKADDGTYSLSPVTVGVSNGNYVEIKEGVEEGETVYVQSKASASSGSSVLSSLFGSQTVNTPTTQGTGGHGSGSGGGWSGSGSGSGSGFGGGMPSMP